MNEREGRYDGGSLDDGRVLRLLIAAAILLTCVFIGCIDVTLRRQSILLGAQLDNAQKLWDNYEKTEQKIDQMRANLLFGALNEYAKTHPDYQPMIQAAERNLVMSPSGAKKK
jgi:hypothetical protein